jgi:5-methylcytosine-specific restriction protein B
MTTEYGAATTAKIDQVIAACTKHGASSIIALAGVPGTGKSFIAPIAAQRYAGHPTLMKEVQFHPALTYEEFVEGMRVDQGGGVRVASGIFLDWNEAATNDPDRKYVLLIEELTRANVPSVIGELMTYVEYRDRPMTTVYGRQSVKIAKNLTILATYNPTDRSAIDLDAALLRRMRIIRCLPDPDQLDEMLKGRTLSDAAIAALKNIFDACRRTHPSEYEHMMPFGHGVFAEMRNEQPDLYDLWEERLRHLLYRPLVDPHPFAEVIEKAYPWRNPDYKSPS